MKWHQRFFWLLLLFLPTQLGFHFWPDWAGVLGRRVDYLAPTIYLTDILLFATLLFWFKESISKKYTPSFILYSLFFILIGTNIYGADNQMVAIYKWGKVTEFVLLGWYIVRTKPKLSTIITPLSIGVFYSSILAIAQLFLQHSVGGPLWWLGERTFTIDSPGIARTSTCLLSHVSCPILLRPYATFPHPNVLGGFLATALPLILVSARQSVSASAKKYFYITFFIGIIALGLTFSRSAIVVGAVAIALAIARIRNYELRIKEHTAIKFSPIILYSLFFILLFVVFANIDLREESVVVRQQLNVAAIKLWTSAPLFGVGLGNFLVRLPEALPTRTIYFLQPVHNIYLLLLSEVGVVGIGLIVLSLWALLRQETRNKRQEMRKFEHVACLVSLVSVLILGLVDHYPLSLQQGQLLLTVLAARAVLSVH